MKRLQAFIVTLCILYASSPGCLAPGDGGGMEICTQRPTGQFVCTSTSPLNRRPPVAPILGQPDSVSYLPAITAKGMDGPEYIASDGTHLAVSDTNNSRVLLWNTMPTVIDQPADLVIGQTSMTGNSVNQGGTVGAGTLNFPKGVAIASGKLLVADTSNHRILIWNTWPTSNGQSADVVVGQATFTSSSSGTTQTALKSPTHVSVDASSHMIVTDQGNHRVLYYASIPTTNNAPATNVIGQAAFTTSAFGTTQSALNTPNAASALGNALAVADGINNRVLIYAFPPAANGPNATIVLGQNSFTTSTPNCSATGLSLPLGVYLKSTGGVYVADSSGNRIMFWSNVSALANGQAASAVFGQPDFVSCTSSPIGPNQTNLSSPNDMYSDIYNRLWVVDTVSNRVTINDWY